MYPTLYDAFLDLFGISIPFLKLVQSFGFFVAMAFLAAMYTLTSEIVRREKEGRLLGRMEKEWTGKPLPISEYLLSALIGLIIGHKLVGIILNFDLATADTQAYILSLQGSLVGGILFAAIGVYLTYKEDPKFLGQTPELVDRMVMPHEWVGNITMIAVVAGILGAKIFHNLENPQEFAEDPIDALTSFSGLTFYGGLICAAAGIIYYARKKGIKVLHLCDSTAPGLILAYGIGRIGCQVAGDGDWGIPNDMPKPDWMSFLPDWTWAYNYPNNVHHINLKADFIGMGLESISGNAFPTPLYETSMALLIFAGLWITRKHFTTPGTLFSVYLIFNGIERFLIEQIRVNVKFEFLGMMVTQAQLISTTLILLGLFGLVWLKRNPTKLANW